MKKKAFINLYKQRGYDDAAIDKAAADVETLEGWLQQRNFDFESCCIGDIKKYIRSVLRKRTFDLNEALALGRYFYIAGNNSVYIYFTKITGGAGVVGSIRKRMEKLAGTQTADAVFDGLYEPPPGTPFEEIPLFTAELMRRFESSAKPEVYKKALAGNNHGIPEAVMQTEKELYEQAQSMEEYLKGRHERKVKELQEHCDSGKVWFEQQITQPVVDFVKANQEILSAAKKGNKLYVTKIPYDTEKYLDAQDLKEKHYYACHCPFVRESLLNGDVNVPANWCYCSAGFAKFPFEVILGRELDVKLLKSPLKGDLVCRFEIDLGEGLDK